MSDLEIPDRAVELLSECQSDYTAHTRAARIIVATELRCLARVHAAPPKMWPPHSRSDLLVRADELDPEGRTRG